MSLNEILLICAALLPAITLCVYIYIKDRAEKEPIGLLLGLLGLGCVICLPAALLETLFMYAIDFIFAPLAWNGLVERLYIAVECIFDVALVEEGLKFLVLFLVTSKNKNFNSLFDGIIYAVFVSLGFAALENVLYVLENGWINAIMRAIMSVPGHMFFAVMMGYYYSLWHMCELARAQEQRMKWAGLIPADAKEFSGKGYLVKSLVVPILIHGLYDYCCSVGTLLATLGLIAIVVAMYIVCFRRIRLMSRYDTDDISYTAAMIRKKYPHLGTEVR